MLYSLFLLPLLANGWTLKDTYQGMNFFGQFDFFTSGDPTHGYVDYVSQSEATSEGLINATTSKIYMGADNKNVASGSGRKSVRITSKTTYNTPSLFILDLSHMPACCGCWPAYWLVGPSWPNSGEVDIIENVDLATNDQSTLHTNEGCSFKNVNGGLYKNFTGTWGTGSNGQPSADCYINAAGEYSNQGCGIINNNAASFGNPFNNKKGGVYAVEWTSEGIFMWFWNTGSVPSNVISNSPNPDSWGTPYAGFPFGSWCPASKFKNQQIVFDLTFCGDWDGSVFGTDCPNDAGGNCESWVKNNPSEFKEAYWIVDYIKVFQ